MPRKLVKDRKYHFIYKTTNKLSGKYYIGMHSTDNLKDGYLGSGRRLGYSVRKYGKENHERAILEFLNSREELSKREEEIVNLDEVAREECMNLKVGGDGGFQSCNEYWSDPINKQRKKDEVSLQMKERWKSDKYRKDMEVKLSNKMKAQWKDPNFSSLMKEVSKTSFKDRKHSSETKELMRQKKIGHGSGKSNSQFGKVWIFNIVQSKNMKVHKDNIDDYLKSGWQRGRNKNFKII